MTAAGQHPDTPGQAVDDPWSFDLKDRIALAQSILNHTDAQHWQQAIDRALLALAGASIDEIREVAS